MRDVTCILSAIEQGEVHAAEQLLPLIYNELRRLATHKLAQENPGQTLQATALVHEAYIRLVDVKKVQHWDSRGHFFIAAAEAMRRILVERARRARTEKHGGRMRRVELDDGIAVAASKEHPEVDLIALDEALREFEIEEPAKARLVKLRYFAGLSIDESASTLGISPASAKRQWIYARSYLYGKMQRR